jgi:hypothetical protein
MKISLIFVTRNDDYNGGSLDRLNFSLKSLRKVLDGVPFEVVIVDYNPPIDRPRMSEVISSPFIKHVVVEPEQHIKCLDKHLELGAKFQIGERFLNREEVLYICPYIGTIGFDVGLYASEGEYVICTSTDNMFTKSFKDLINNLRPKVLYRSMRKNVPSNRVEDLFTRIIEEQKLPNVGMDKLNQSKNNINKATGDFLLMDRNSWLEIGGYIPIFHVRAKEADSIIMWWSFLYGLTVNSVKSCLVNIHKDVPEDRKALSKGLNYIIDYNGMHYDHFQEIDSDPYKKFRAYCKGKTLDPGQIFSYGDSKGLRRVTEVINNFKSIWKYTID